MMSSSSSAGSRGKHWPPSYTDHIKDLMRKEPNTSFHQQYNAGFVNAHFATSPILEFTHNTISKHAKDAYAVVKQEFDAQSNMKRPGVGEYNLPQYSSFNRGGGMQPSIGPSPFNAAGLPNIPVPREIMGQIKNPGGGSISMDFHRKPDALPNVLPPMGPKGLSSYSSGGNAQMNAPPHTHDSSNKWGYQPSASFVAGKPSSASSNMAFDEDAILESFEATTAKFEPVIVNPNCFYVSYTLDRDKAAPHTNIYVWYGLYPGVTEALASIDRNDGRKLTIASDWPSYFVDERNYMPQDEKIRSNPYHPVHMEISRRMKELIPPGKRVPQTSLEIRLPYNVKPLTPEKVKTSMQSCIDCPDNTYALRLNLDIVHGDEPEEDVVKVTPEKRTHDSGHEENTKVKSSESKNLSYKLKEARQYTIPEYGVMSKSQITTRVSGSLVDFEEATKSEEKKKGSDDDDDDNLLTSASEEPEKQA